MYLNTQGFNLPHGLGFGGTFEGFRLFIPDTFEGCIARSMCPTYESGRLIFHEYQKQSKKERISNLTNSVSKIEENEAEEEEEEDTMDELFAEVESFEIMNIEVWGSGGYQRVEHGLLAQQEARKIMYENIDKARKVDKAQFFSNGFDREFLLSNTFSHQKDMQERVEEEYTSQDNNKK
jgi:hypothetical protein